MPHRTANFGLLADAAQFNVKDRPGQWEYNVSVQHELISRLSVGMAYYRRNYYNFWREDNVLQSSGDYTRFGFRGPADPRLNEFAGSTQTLFNLSPTVFGQSQRVLNNVDNISGPGTSVCITALNGRCRDGSATGGFFGGSVNYEKTQESTCSVENRNSTIWCDSPRAWQTQFKANASYPIPKVDIVTSVLLQGYPGPDISANYTATPATVLCSDRHRRDGRCGTLPTICFRRIPTSSRSRRRWICGS